MDRVHEAIAHAIISRYNGTFVAERNNIYVINGFSLTWFIFIIVNDILFIKLGKSAHSWSKLYLITQCDIQIELSDPLFFNRIYTICDDYYCREKNIFIIYSIIMIVMIVSVLIIMYMLVLHP